MEPASRWEYRFNVNFDERVLDPHNLNIVTQLNGEVMQEDNTRNMVFSIERLLVFWSAIATLEPGDVLATGTPEGVGAFQDPPRFLKDGDVVNISIEGIGTLENPVVREGRS